MSLPIRKNLGPKARGLRVAAGGGFLVVAFTVVPSGIGRIIFCLLGVWSLLAAATGYGPAYRWISRLRGKPNPNDEPF